jgi:hypothetical protein
MSKLNVSAALVLGCWVAVFGAANQAAAQRPPRFDLSVLGGGYFASDLYNGTNSITSGTTKVHLSDSWTYGGRLGFTAQNHIGLEFSYARAVSDASASNPVASPGLTGASVALNQFDFNLLFGQPQGNRGIGYFTLGFGWTDVVPSIPNSTATSNSFFAWNFGLGLKAYMGRSALFRIDARYRGVDTNRTTGVYNYCDYYGYCYTYASSIYYSGEVTAGLGVRF